MKLTQIDLFKNGLPEDICAIAKKMKENDFEIYLVGGAVRNLILSDKRPKGFFRNFDFDFTTNARPEEVISLFKEKGKSSIFTVPTGLAHGTVTVVIEKDGVFHHYEITTYRLESQYEDGRHPEKISFSNSLEEDLSRRDFTINALAYDVFEKTLFDPFDGLGDLEKELIRTVGNPLERFREDGLRPIRACRFAAMLDFQIEEETLKSIRASFDTVTKVSLERVHDELLKLMKSEKPSIGIEYLRITGLLELFIPELMEGYQVYQNEFHKHDIYYHNLYTCDAVFKEKPLIRLAGLFHDIGKARAKSYALASGNGNVFYNHEIIGERMADKIMKRLKFSNQDIRYVKNLVKLHMFYYTEEWTDGAVRRFLKKMEGDSGFLKDLFELRKADRIGSGMKSGEAEILEKFKRRINVVTEADSALKVTDLNINGYDIMQKFNLKPSRMIGEMLEFMLERILDQPELNNQESLFELGEEFLRQSHTKSDKNEEEEAILI
jgi:poly(A) polymerase/tRNA nucleotidyltransferase (CCA-adding enzyme)